VEETEYLRSDHIAKWLNDVNSDLLQLNDALARDDPKAFAYYIRGGSIFGPSLFVLVTPFVCCSFADGCLLFSAL
jgi:hypothetical protein